MVIYSYSDFFCIVLFCPVEYLSKRRCAMKGEQVIVRAYGNQPLVRRVWGEGKKVIYITNDSNDGPIGFPRGDVFKYDQNAVNLIKDKQCDWSKLKPWANAK
jgi:hypothetical protein